MKKFLILSISLILILLVGCAERKGGVIESTFKGNKETKSTATTPGTIQPTFSVFKGGKISKEKGIQSEQIEEAKISGSENYLGKNQNTSCTHKKIDFKLRDIHFDFDSYTIKPEDIPYLESLAEWLNKHPGYSLVIEGHCDERGSELYNLALGQRRADAVKDFLVNLGVDPKRIKTISYGEEMPIDPRHNEEAWAKNRRCHFIIE